MLSATFKTLGFLDRLRGTFPTVPEMVRGVTGASTFENSVALTKGSSSEEMLNLFKALVVGNTAVVTVLKLDEYGSLVGLLKLISVFELGESIFAVLIFVIDGSAVSREVCIFKRSEK